MNWTDLPFAVFLLVLSSLMLFWHMASWKEVSRSDLPAAAFEFHYRRHRRRSLASALIGFVGLAIICGMWVGDGWQPIAYWSVVAIIVLWIACLAMADLSHTNQMLRQINTHHVAEQTALLAEAKRMRTTENEETFAR